MEAEEARSELVGTYEDRISASQIEEFLKCWRKWGLHRLGKVPKIQGEALLFGIDLHESLRVYTADREQWRTIWMPGGRVRTGPPGTTGGRAAKIVCLTQAMARVVQILPGDEVLREPEWLLPIHELEVDLYIKPDMIIRREGRLYVPDWKSTSATSSTSEWVLQGLRPWGVDGPAADAGVDLGRGRRTLWNAPQPRIYVHGMCELFGDPAGTVHWVYGCKAFKPPSEPKVWSVIETFTREQARAWFQRYMIPVIRTMLALRRAHRAGDFDSPLLIPHREEGCEAKGKFCDALGVCKFQTSPIDRKEFERHLPVIPS